MLNKFFTCFLAALSAASLFIVGCKKDPVPPAPGVPVVMAQARLQSVPVELTNFGTVEAFATVEVKSQVAGVIEKVHFTQGQFVKKGDLLLTIDDRQYVAAHKLAQANLEKDLAQLDNAKKEAQRQTELLQKGVTSQDAYDQAIADSQALAASINADNAAIENARLKVEYCSIRSPIDGVVGSLFIHQGNVVKENDAVIVTINQVKPIYVDFSLPQQYLSPIRRNMASSALNVQAVIPGDKASVSGRLWFVNNTIDVQTGTIKLKAVFDNNDLNLWPGQFVDVSLTLSIQDNAIVIPSPAVQTGQQGQFVFVVTPGMTVESRPITVNRTIDGLSVIDNGLAPGENIVTDGQLRLVPGAKVEIAKPVTQAKETIAK